jgi:hypothetical protein
MQLFLNFFSDFSGIFTKTGDVKHLNECETIVYY